MLCLSPHWHSPIDVLQASSLMPFSPRDCGHIFPELWCQKPISLIPPKGLSLCVSQATSPSVQPSLMLLPSTAESLLHHDLQLPHGRAATWLLSPTVCLRRWLFQCRRRFALVFTKSHSVYFQTIPLITEISWVLILSSLVSLAVG